MTNKVLEKLDFMIWRLFCKKGLLFGDTDGFERELIFIISNKSTVQFSKLLQLIKRWKTGDAFQLSANQ